MKMQHEHDEFEIMPGGDDGVSDLVSGNSVWRLPDLVLFILSSAPFEGASVEEDTSSVPETVLVTMTIEFG